MLFLSSKKRVVIDERTKTLKDVREDVRETKHILCLYKKPIDEAEHHCCFFMYTFTIRSIDSPVLFEEHIKTLEKLREEGSDKSCEIIDNNGHNYYKYLGEIKPKNLPEDYASKPLNWDKLMDAIRCMSYKPKGIHFGIAFYLIKKGLFGKGFEKMKQAEYRRKLKESGFIESTGRDNISHYYDFKKGFDYLYFNLPIGHKITDKNKKVIEKEEELRRLCCTLIDHYWLLMKQ